MRNKSQVILAASCLAVILVGGYSLKQTLDEMRRNKWLADECERYTRLLLNSPRCITTGHIDDNGILHLPEGVCQLSPLDVGEVIQISGEGVEKTVILYNR